MEMSRIKMCSVSSCSYNGKNMCHALGINVGDQEPICDTFMGGHVKCADNTISGGVGACKMESCKFNSCLECSAPGIEVVWENNMARCETFKQK